MNENPTVHVLQWNFEKETMIFILSDVRVYIQRHHVHSTKPIDYNSLGHDGRNQTNQMILLFLSVFFILCIKR